MSRDKQIEEMAKTMCFSKEHCTVKSCVEVNCETTWLAERLYNTGYRKASRVAEEIFAEIEDYMLGIQVNGFPALVINPDAFAELKKKYTEEGE